jgi:tRNA (uracil-5-)-methyltransferase
LRQFQALSYDKQLEIKQTVVRTAFRNFANLEPNLVPEIGPTLPSPLQYQYRTKLTPHFSIKPVQKSTEPLPADDDHAIGFDRKFLIKGKDKILDIEECVIATEVINEALAIKREVEKK